MPLVLLETRRASHVDDKPSPSKGASPKDLFFLLLSGRRGGFDQVKPNLGTFLTLRFA